MPLDAAGVAGAVYEIVEGYLRRSLAPALDKLQELGARLAAIETRQPERGEKGDPGDRGDAGPSGPQGDRGEDGAGIAAIVRDGNRLSFELSDGRVFDAGELPRGERGEAGPQGIPGRDGRDGLSAVGVADGKNLNSAAEFSEMFAPDDVAERVGKAISLLAESPSLASLVAPVSAPAPQPIALSVFMERGATKKTVTTRRGEDGNLVAEVIES